MNRGSQEDPEWLTVGKPLLWPTIRLAEEMLREEKDPQIMVSAVCAGRCRRSVDSLLQDIAEVSSLPDGRG
jgi:hypothetical protein